MIHPAYKRLLQKQERLLDIKNKRDTKSFGGGAFDRYVHPILTRDHVPLEWRYDLARESNPFFLERLGVNAVFNAGAIYHEGIHYLLARVEGVDRKSYFALAQSHTGIDRFRFVHEPLKFDDIDLEETNVYDMRLIHHEDGYIYGMFCSEKRDPDASSDDTSSAVASIGILRTKDLVHYERLPNLITPSPQQRNVVLHPEFVQGKYLLYTRPQDGFIESGKGGGIAYGFVEKMEHPIISEERLLQAKRYHTVYEMKNGLGPAPIKTSEGWLHIAHGVRNTANGLRYVLYLFMTDLSDPTRLTYMPGGYVLAPRGRERIGDVSNVLFANGVTVNEKREVFLYYASSDTRMHVATSTVDRLIDYCINTPQEVYRSTDSVNQRLELIRKNQEFMKDRRK